METLLSHIAEEGGFRDACTVFQESSILELEKGLEKLSERCRKWKVLFLLTCVLSFSVRCVLVLMRVLAFSS